MAGHDLGRPSRVLDRGVLSADVRRLSQVSNLRGALAIAREWSLIAGLVTAAVLSGEPLVWGIAGVLIATRQHALLILMHDAAHGRLMRGRALNDAVGDLFLALPNNVMLRRYRIRHSAHHGFANDRTRDPDRTTIAADDQWHFPRARLSGITVFLRDLLGLNSGRAMRVVTLYAPWPVLMAGLWKTQEAVEPADAPATRAEAVRVGLYVVALSAGLVLSGGWAVYLALWVLPSMTVLPALLRLRGISEHEGDMGTDEVSVSRHVEAGMAEAFVISPFHINYHTAHHLFPSVPWYNLPALHARLMEEAAYRERLVCASSYTGPGGVLDTLMPSTTESKATLGTAVAQ
jgi:fatty acid desaturase